MARERCGRIRYGKASLYAQRTAPLTVQQRAAMTGFFSAEVLDTRVLTLNNERVQNPDFYPKLEAMGFHNLPDQSAMAAITLSDIVVSHVPLDNGLLFHELVHIEQYRQLDIPRFSELYVRGFLSGGCYEHIPLEVHAYALGSQYAKNPAIVIDVQNAVTNHIREHRY